MNLRPSPILAALLVLAPAMAQAVPEEARTHPEAYARFMELAEMMDDSHPLVLKWHVDKRAAQIAAAAAEKAAKEAADAEAIRKAAETVAANRKLPNQVSWTYIINDTRYEAYLAISRAQTFAAGRVVPRREKMSAQFAAASGGGERFYAQIPIYNKNDIAKNPSGEDKQKDGKNIALTDQGDWFAIPPGESCCFMIEPSGTTGRIGIKLNIFVIKPSGTSKSFDFSFKSLAVGKQIEVEKPVGDLDGVVWTFVPENAESDDYDKPFLMISGRYGH